MRHLLPLIVVLGCAHQSWQDPGSRWNTGSTAHFRLHGDGSRGSVEDLLLRLEGSYVALGATFFPRTEIPVVEGMVLSDDEEFMTLVDHRRVVGMFITGVGPTGLISVREPLS